MPSNFSSRPIGKFTGTAFKVRRSRIDCKLFSKDAPIRSSLLIKQSRGTSYLSAWCQTVSDCGSTPATPSKTTTAPSKTRRERWTSAVKSMWPGVSIILMRCSSDNKWVGVQKVVVAAAVMVIPRSLSCSIQSITAAPSWTSPILWEIPV